MFCVILSEHGLNVCTINALPTSGSLKTEWQSLILCITNVHWHKNWQKEQHKEEYRFPLTVTSVTINEISFFGTIFVILPTHNTVVVLNCTIAFQI